LVVGVLHDRAWFLKSRTTLPSPQVLSQFVKLFLLPETADNQPLRQCLSYFLPVYCFSSSVNQRRMQKVRCAVAYA
jgi:hypothetical protein